ncbi:MAG: hypothetical protein IKM59_02075 [Oscillospiraceae bacterium]|nr:hypothetical protein [Oscillospiraceae bacterium]
MELDNFSLRIEPVYSYNYNDNGDSTAVYAYSYYYDVETGFYYLQSRYYDPANQKMATGFIFIGDRKE